MLKITVIDRPTGTATGLRLEGKLLEPWLGELQAACAALGSAQPPELDLAAVSFVDTASARRLQDLITAGARVTACSGFVAELLQGPHDER
jgi:hypothetical protein